MSIVIDLVIDIQLDKLENLLPSNQTVKVICEETLIAKMDLCKKDCSKEVTRYFYVSTSVIVFYSLVSSQYRRRGR